MSACSSLILMNNLQVPTIISLCFLYAFLAFSFLFFFCIVSLEEKPQQSLTNCSSSFVKLFSSCHHLLNYDKLPEVIEMRAFHSFTVRTILHCKWGHAAEPPQREKISQKCSWLWWYIQPRWGERVSTHAQKNFKIIIFYYFSRLSHSTVSKLFQMRDAFKILPN